MWLLTTIDIGMRFVENKVGKQKTESSIICLVRGKMRSKEDGETLIEYMKTEEGIGTLLRGLPFSDPNKIVPLYYI